jgi:hypothetical protein
MKKKVSVLFVVAVLALLIGGLFVGTKIGASTGWSNELATFANSELGATGFEKKEEILGNDITAEMKVALDPKIAEEQAALEKLLEDYYQMKLNNLENTPEYLALEKQIEGLKQTIFLRYSKEIDLMFEGA